MKNKLDYPSRTLADALVSLGNSHLLPLAVTFLKSRADEINAELQSVVLAEIPAFSQSHNPDVLPDLARHGPQHTDEILRLLMVGKLGDFEFIREHVRRRAEHRFPLEATLHAYRCGHKVFLRWLRDAILAVAPDGDDREQLVTAVADFTIEYTDVISTVAAKAYVAQTRFLAEVDGDQRSELLNILLEGFDESDGRVAKILRNAGYLERRQSHCVALGRTVDPGEMFNPARARRVAESIGETLQNSSARRVIDLRDNHVVMIFSHTRRSSGWTAPNAKLANQLATELLLVGNAVLIGVSDDVPSTSQIPNAYRQAQTALDLADVTNRVIQYSSISVRRLMLHFAGEELTRVLPVWSKEFFRSDDKQNGALVKTIQAYAEANMNVLKAAEILAVHPNTIYARFQRIIEITNLDARSYYPLTELLIVAECRSE
ncbi:MAG: hypothetical protein ACI9BW_004081 [Gammaproteobacteria bacterium]|jgi:hypothetical protein